MRWLAIVLAMAGLGAQAFDLNAWRTQRDLHLREAERLRVAYSNCLQRLDHPAEDVTVPVETHENGAIRLVVRARRAQFFLDTGLVWAENVVVLKFAQGGELETRIDARSCVVDRFTKSGWAEGAARVQHGKTELGGRNVYFSSPESYVRVFDGADLKTEGAREGGKGAKTSETTRIRSLLADYDRAAGVAAFENRVVVDHAGEYTMNADSLYAVMSASNELSRVVANGNVTITNAARVGTCAMATYRRGKREMEMFGDGGALHARLVDTGDHPGELEGDRIKFWLDAEQVEVKNSMIQTESREGAKFL